MAKKEKPTFEENIERLDGIIAELESDSTHLDASLKLYKEGVGLLEQCIQDLRQAELTITELRKRSDGIFELLDMDDKR